MVAAAPEFEELADAEVPPTWDGRVGDDIDTAATPPAIPTFTQISSGFLGTGDVDGLEILLTQGAGSSATVTSFVIETRLSGAATWTSMTVPTAASGASSDLYSAGDAVQIRAAAVASTVAGDYTVIVDIVIGADDPEIPAALDEGTVSVSGSMGHAILVFAFAADAPEGINIYRVPEGTSLDQEAHLVVENLAVTQGSTVNYIDGDATRVNLLSTATFDGTGGWTAGDGWSLANGEAEHVAGLSGDLTRSLSMTSGKVYRLAIDIDGRTAGSVQAVLQGGTEEVGALIEVDGLALDSLTADASSDVIGLSADASFDGSISSFIAFEETAACVDSGLWEYWIEPVNSSGIAGPMTGPIETTVL